MPHNLLRGIVIEIISRMDPQARIFIGSVGLIATVAYAGKLEAERLEDRQRAQHERDIETLSKVDSLCAEYNESVRHLASRSMKICRKWTSTNCESAIDIVPFLEKYAKIKAVEEEQVVGITAAKDLEDYKVLEAFRRDEMKFWVNKVHRQGFLLNSFNYPGRNELRIFSTFHWAVYMVVNKCAYDIGNEGKEPYPYKWVEESIFDSDETKEYIETYRDTLKKEFPRIQRKIFKKN